MTLIQRFDKSSDTMVTRYQIEHGAYVFRGSIYPQLAKSQDSRNGDALAIKNAIINMFMNDASAARPAGSMTLDRLYWVEHNCPERSNLSCESLSHPWDFFAYGRTPILQGGIA